MADPVNYCSWLYRYFCITQSEWAAWTQAGMSVAAIVFASRLAASQEAKVLSRRTMGIVNLIEEVDAQCFWALSCYQSKYRLINKNETGAHDLDRCHDELKQAKYSLRTITLHDLPDNRLQGLINAAIQACDEVMPLIDLVDPGGELPEPAVVTRLNGIARRMSNVRNRAWQVSSTYLSLRARIWGRVSFYFASLRWRIQAASAKS